MKLIPIIIAGALMVGSGLTGVIGGSVKIAQENGGDQGGGTTSEPSTEIRSFPFHADGSLNVYLTRGEYVYYSYVPYESFTANFFSTSSLLDPRAWLLEGTTYGRTLAEDDDGGDGNNFSFTYDVQAYRTYILKVYTYPNHGSGWATFYVTRGGSSTSSTPAWNSEAPSGQNQYTIYESNPVWVSCSYDNPATLTFNPNSNSTYAFYSTGNYDTYGELYQISMGYSQSVATNDDSDGSNFRIEYYCSVSFIYNLKVRPYSPSAGTISFYVYCDYV